MFVEKLNIAKTFAWAGLISFIGFALLCIKNGVTPICSFLLLISIVCCIVYGTLKSSKDSASKYSLSPSDTEEINSMPLDLVNQEVKIWEFGVYDSSAKESLKENPRYQELKKRQIYLTHPELVDPHIFPTPDPTLDND